MKVTAPQKHLTRYLGREHQDFVKGLLAGDDTFATTILLLACDRFGTECLTPDVWSRETFRMELMREYGAAPSSGNLDRLMAACDIVTSDAFYADVDTFVRHCNVLAGSDADFETVDVASVDECAWGVTEATLLWPAERETFAPEVAAYLKERLKYEGFTRPPGILAHLVTSAELSVESDFADDPVLYSAVGQAGRSKATEVEQGVTADARELLDQLKPLRLRNGDQDKFITKMRRIIDAST